MTVTFQILSFVTFKWTTDTARFASRELAAQWVQAMRAAYGDAFNATV